MRFPFMKKTSTGTLGNVMFQQGITKNIEQIWLLSFSIMGQQ